MSGQMMLDACAHHRRPPVRWPGFVKGCPVHALQRSLRRTNRVSAALCCAATHGTHIKTTHASDLGHARVGKPKNLANRVPVRYGRGTNTGALNASLFGALLQSAAQQASHQLQGTLEQVNKLTKGFQPRPEGYPPGPPGDSAADMLLDPLRFLERMSKQYGPVVGLVLGGESVILVTEGHAAQQVLISKAATYKKEGTAFFPGSSLAGQGLLVSDGAIWQRQRQLTNPAFRRAAVEAYAAAMSQATQHMLSNTWADRGTRDVYADYNELTLSITTNALFGVDMSSSQSAGISNAVRVAFDFFSKRAALGFMVPEWLPTPENVQYHAAVAQLDTAVYGIIADRQQRLLGKDAPTRKNQCLLDNLLLSKDENGEGLSLQSLRDQLMTLLVAGQETSAILLGWTTAFLAHHPHVQKQAAAEVQQVLQGEAPTPENIRDLPLLERVVLESLRLRPPAYMVGRCAAQADVLAGYSVRPGTTILVSPYVMHRDKDQWHNPLAFNPDRWYQYQEPRDSSAGGMSSTIGTSSAAGISSNDRIPSNSSSRSSSNCNASSSNGNVSSSTQGFAEQSSSTIAAHSNVQHAYVHGRQSDASSSTGEGSGHQQGIEDATRDSEQGRAVGSSGPELASLSGKSGQRQKAKAGAASILSGMGPNGTYVPFGAGPRNCIGTGFAMMEAMLVLAAALQNIEFGVASEQAFPQATPRITLRPAAVELVLRPRTSSNAVRN